MAQVQFQSNLGKLASYGRMAAEGGDDDMTAEESWAEYTVTVEKGADRKLGIDVDQTDDETMLVVVLVKGGLIGEWNESNPKCQVEPGHRIVEVNGFRGEAEGLKAECRRGHQLNIRLQRPAPAGVSVIASGIDMPDSAWMQVIWFLQTHEVLGRIAIVSRRFAAMLGDERSWQSLAMPCGAGRLEKLLSLMAVEERDLWAWPLCQVQVVDLDLQGCNVRSLSNLKRVLQCLDVCSTLNQLALRKVNAFPQQDELEQLEGMSAAHRTMVKLVNPVLPNFPAGAQVVFLLVPAELGQLRVRMAGFGHFRVTPDDAGSSITLLAERCPLPVLELPSGGDKDDSCQEIGGVSEQAACLLELEIGALRHLSGAALGTSFGQWSGRLLRFYATLIIGSSSGALASLVGGATGTI